MVNRLMVNGGLWYCTFKNVVPWSFYCLFTMLLIFTIFIGYMFFHMLSLAISSLIVFIK